MKTIDFLQKITDHAVDYSSDAVASIMRNKHMNDLTERLNQEQVNAVLVDFINYVASTYGVDYGLYTSDITKNEN